MSLTTTPLDPKTAAPADPPPEPAVQRRHARYRARLRAVFAGENGSPMHVQVTEVSEAGLTMFSDVPLKVFGKGVVFFKLPVVDAQTTSVQANCRIVHEHLAGTQFRIGVEILEFQFGRALYMSYLQGLVA